MKTIVNNLAVEYADEGRGPVVLMLHGWKDDLRTFDAIATSLAEKHRVVRLDLPGFGGSEAPRGAWHLSDYADFVRAFVEKLKLEVDTLVGHSLGGRITIKSVSSGALKPRKIVLIASAGIAKRKTIRNTALRVLAKAGKTLTALPPFSIWSDDLRRKLYERIGSDYFAAGKMRSTFVYIIEEDLQEAARKIDVPALLIWGSEDAATPLEDGKRLHKLVGGSRLEVVDGATHFVHQESPEEVASLIKDFL